MKRFLKKLDAPKGTKYALFNTHAMDTPRALPKMEKILAKKGMVKIADSHARVTGSGEECQLKEGFEDKLAALADAIIS